MNQVRGVNTYRDQDAISLKVEEFKGAKLSDNPRKAQGILQDAKAALFDFDGTIARTEKLHQASFAAAVCSVFRLEMTPQICFETFPKAWGKTEMGSCLAIVEVIKEKFPANYQRAVNRRDLESRGAENPDIALAHRLRSARGEAVEWFSANSQFDVRQYREEGLPPWKEETPVVSLKANAKFAGKRWSAKCFEGAEVAITPGLVDVLQFLRTSGKPMGIVTSSGGGFIREVLKAFRLTDYFCTVVSSDDVGNAAKPHTNPWRIAMRRFNREYFKANGAVLRARDFVAFENSVGGALSAFTAGINTLVADVDSNFTAEKSRRAIAEKLAKDNPVQQDKAGPAIGVPVSIIRPDDGAEVVKGRANQRRRFNRFAQQEEPALVCVEDWIYALRPDRA